MLIVWIDQVLISALNRRLLVLIFQLRPILIIKFSHFSTWMLNYLLIYLNFRCRKTQAVFDKCMLDNLKIERPYFGYFSEVKVHHTERPRPEVKKQEYLDMPRPVPDDLPLQPAKFGKRSLS